MVSTAVGAGVALGIGLSLVASQLFLATPSPALVVGGLVLGFLGLVCWSDQLVEERRRSSKRRVRIR